MQSNAENRPRLTILTVNYNSASFVRFMLDALEKLTSSSYEVIVCDNGSTVSDLLVLKNALTNRSNASVYYRQQTKGGSAGHGKALDFICSKVETEYFAVIDADAAFLIKDWDRILIDRLTGTVKAIGTQAAGGKVQDFPHIYGVLFDTVTFRALGCHFSPAPGDVIDPHRDTGWEIREKFHAADLKGEVLEMKNTREWKYGPFRDLICGEFYLQGIDHIFASHYGRGSTLGAAKRRGVWTRIPVLRRVIAAEIGARERDLWIKTAQQVVDSQLPAP
jgi:glycosyltransferase involved in cell wall biosynthesis